MNPQPQAAVSAPLSRVDGRLKVTGQAKYAADHEPSGSQEVVHAVVVDSGIGRGRITGIDTRAAEAQPGVLKVLHHRNAPKLPYGPNPGSLNLPGERLRVFQDGAMGSRRTHTHRLELLRAAGVPDPHLARLHSPVGLDLGAHTPEETALSIAAEITAHTHQRSGTPLSWSTGPIHRRRSSA